MTNQPGPDEIQRRILHEMAKAYKEGTPHLTDEELAQQLGMSNEELQREIRGLIDIGFIGRGVMDSETGDVRPMPPCRRCGKPSDGLDQLCLSCRAIWACDHLCNDLTNALEKFLDRRWAPHEYGKPRPAYYVSKPNFDGDPAPYMAQIATAHKQVASAAARLVRLAMGPEVRTKVEGPYEPHYYGPDDYPESFNGINAAIDWGFTEASNDRRIECRRIAMSYLADMVRNHEVLLPGDQVPDQPLPGDRLGNAPWSGLTEAGRRQIEGMHPGDPGIFDD